MNFNQICKDIKTLKIQGATNVAKAAIKALKIRHDKKAIQKLISLRPTEPALRNAINFVKKDPEKLAKKALDYLNFAEKKIAKIGAKKVEDNSIIFTHCHSGTVVNILKQAKKTKKFEVYNTETRPLYQGRITARELAKSRIKVTHFVDSAARVLLKEADLMLMGVDAITSEGKIVNKIGTEMFVETANRYNTPIYFCTVSWKFDPLTIKGYKEKIEERSPDEVWKNPPKNVKIKNLAFEFINPNLVTGIISELGIYSPTVFVERVIEKHPWIYKND